MSQSCLGDKGGLYNHVTRKLYLAPFTLGETAEFLHNNGVEWTHHIWKSLLSARNPSDGQPQQQKPFISHLLRQTVLNGTHRRI